MPLSLLLQQTVNVLAVGTLGLTGAIALDARLEITGALRGGSFRGLSAWTELVRIEETLIDRARSAFLVHWFGTRLPLEGRSLRVTIDNIDALRDRYAAVNRSMQRDPTGPNLTEPIAGFVGVLAGTLLSPFGFLATLVVLDRLLPTWVVILCATFRHSLVPLIALVIGGAGAGLGIPVGIALVAGDDGTLREIYGLLGAGAELLIAARRFLDLLTGPRASIHNPLLLRILEVFDRVAILLPFAMAFVAVVVTRVGHLIAPIIDQISAMSGLFSAVFDGVTFLMEDMIERLRSLTGRRSPFHAVVAVLETIATIPGRVIFWIGDVLLHAEFELSRWASTAFADVPIWWGEVLLAFEYLIRASRPIALIEGVIRQIEIFTDALAHTPVPPPTGPASPPDPDFAALGARISRHVDTAVRAVSGAVPSLPTLPDLTTVTRRSGGAPLGFDTATLERLAAGVPEALLTPFRLDDDARQALERARNPSSVFAGERRALLAPYGGSLSTARAALQAEARPLETALLAIVERLLPPSIDAAFLAAITPKLRRGIRERLPGLRGVFEELDEEVYGAPRLQGGRELPLLQLPDNGLLRPKVARLRVRVAGGYEPEVRAFQETLLIALRGQSYTAPAGP